MTIEIIKLYRLSGSPLKGPDGDITFRLVEWSAESLNHDACWFDCHCLVMGAENHTVPGMNYSTSLLDNSTEWYLPGLFRNQALFLSLLDAGVVTYIEGENELNPAPLFNKDDLRVALEIQGYPMFVRQSFADGMRTDIKESFLLTPHKDIASANAHFQYIRYDQRKYVYHLYRQEELQKLVVAAQQPAGYRIYYAIIPPPLRIPSPRIKKKIDGYTRCNAPWKSSGYNSARIGFRYGELGIILNQPDGFIPWTTLLRY